MPAAGPALQRDSPRIWTCGTFWKKNLSELLEKACSGVLCSPRFIPMVFLDILHGSKERQQMATDSQFTTAEQVHHPQEIQDGDPIRDPQVAVCGPVGHFRTSGRHTCTSQYVAATKTTSAFLTKVICTGLWQCLSASQLPRESSLVCRRP